MFRQQICSDKAKIAFTMLISKPFLSNYYNSLNLCFDCWLVLPSSQRSINMKWVTSWQNQQNGMCAQWRLRSAWASAQSNQSSLSAWRKLGSLATYWAHSEDSDQTGRLPRLAQMPSLIRVFAVRMKKAWVLSYQLSAQRRLWSDLADAQADLSLRWTHSHFVGFVMRRLK